MEKVMKQVIRNYDFERNYPDVVVLVELME
jgi:hypothetical protein